MAANFNLLLNQTQDTEGPAVHFPINGQPAKITFSGDLSGGCVLIDVHDSVMSTWTNLPALTLTNTQPVVTYTFNNTSDALRARLAGGVSPNVTVTVTVNP